MRARAVSPVGHVLRMVCLWGAVLATAHLQAFAQPLPPTLSQPIVRPAQQIQPVPQPTSGLDLARLEHIAQQHNPALASAMARLEAARGRWIQAGLRPNPTFGYLSSEMGNERIGGQHGVFFRQTFITGGKLQAAQAAASNEFNAREQEIAAIRRQVTTDVRRLFYQTLILQHRIELGQRLVKTSEDAVIAVKSLLAQRDARQIDRLQAEIEAHKTKMGLGKTETRHRAAWRQLTAVLGTPDLPMQPLHGNVYNVNVDIAWEAALNRLLSESPLIAAANSRVGRAQWLVQGAYAKAKPNINVQASLQRDNLTRDNFAGVQVGVPLPLWNRNQGGIVQAEAQLTQAQLELDRLRLSLRHQLAQVYGRYDNARLQAKKYAQDILPRAKDTISFVDRGFQAREIGYLELLTAQRTYFQANLSYLDSLEELWDAVQQLDGLLLSGSLKER